MKDLYVKAHEALIDAYMDAKPGCSWTEAYEKTADMAFEAMKDLAAGMIDVIRERAKYE